MTSARAPLISILGALALPASGPISQSFAGGRTTQYRHVIALRPRAAAIWPTVVSPLVLLLYRLDRGHHDRSPHRPWRRPAPRLLEFMGSFTQRNGYQPTIADMATGLDMRCTTVIWHLHALRDEGRITYVDTHVVRSLQPVDDAR